MPVKKASNACSNAQANKLQNSTMGVGETSVVVLAATSRIELVTLPASRSFSEWLMSQFTVTSLIDMPPGANR